jgi:hypothetical protein
MEYLVLFGMSLGFIGLIFLIKNRFVNKTYPQKTNEMADSVKELTFIGFNRNANGYQGQIRNYDVNIYPTTSIKSYGYMQGDMFQVWVNIAPEVGQLKGLGGFFGKYLVIGEKPGFAMIGFTARHYTGSNSAETIKYKLDELINNLIEKGVKPYIV